MFIIERIKAPQKWASFFLKKYTQDATNIDMKFKCLKLKDVNYEEVYAKIYTIYEEVYAKIYIF